MITKKFLLTMLCAGFMGSALHAENKTPWWKQLWQSPWPFFGATILTPVLTFPKAFAEFRITHTNFFENITPKPVSLNFNHACSYLHYVKSPLAKLLGWMVVQGWVGNMGMRRLQERYAKLKQKNRWLLKP
jgi:hypothetical protein